MNSTAPHPAHVALHAEENIDPARLDLKDEAVPPRAFLTPLRAYTVTMEYSATGEGLTQAIVVLMAPDEASARTAFLDAHHYQGEARTFFAHGLVVSEGINTKVLQRWLTPQFLTTLERMVRFNGRFTLHWHFNLS